MAVRILLFIGWVLASLPGALWGEAVYAEGVGLVVFSAAGVGVAFGGLRLICNHEPVAGKSSAHKGPA